MIRVLKERGELNLVKAIIIPESAIGLGNLVNAGITPQDFDHIHSLPAYERRLPHSRCT